MRIAASLLCVAGLVAAIPTIPTIKLKNTAKNAMPMPWIGLGTGGYETRNTSKAPPSQYPECWNDIRSDCGSAIKTAVSSWLKMGGRRLDCANSYFDEQSVGEGIVASGVPREEIFILSKVGPSFPLGGNDAKAQFKDILPTLGVSYVDILLIHWPFQNPSQGNVSHHTRESSTPVCQLDNPVFNATECRLDTWRGMLDIYASGAAHAVGVSNYYINELEEIRLAGLPMPALNQIPYHLYRSSSQQTTLDYCKEHGIQVLGYSPLGIPDWKTFPATSGKAAIQLEDSVLMEVAKKYNRTTAAVTLAWQRQIGIPFNPRSMNPAHMMDNLNSFDLTLTSDELTQLSGRPNDSCHEDPHFYECAP